MERQIEDPEYEEGVERMSANFLLAEGPGQLPSPRHYFEFEPEVKGNEESETLIPCTWIPHAKDNLGNELLSALFLCRTHPEGV